MLLPLISLVIILLFAFRSSTWIYPAKKLPPGPPGLPLIGNLFQLLGVQRRGKPAIVIGSHKVALDLFEKRGSIYSERPRCIVANEIMTRNLVFAFAPHDNSWRRMRRASHEILNNQIVKNYHKFQNIEAVLLVKDLSKAPEFYIRHIQRATTSSLLSVIYGLPPCPDPFDPTLMLVTDLTQSVLDAAAPGQHLVEYFPFLRYLPSRLCSWKRHAEHVFQIADSVFGDLYRQVEKRAERAWLAGTLYAAGSETTSKQMLWFLLSMAIYPDIQAKAQKQIDDIIGRERLPNLDDFERLPYVRALIKELLRWRGVGPFGIPHALSEDDYYEGYLIPKGTDCIVNVWALNHDQDVYGSDADFFRPERHLDQDGQLKLVASRETKDEGHNTFGFGRRDIEKRVSRICVGRHVAVNSLFIQMTCILWCFNITPAEDETGKPIFIDENEMIEDGLTVRPLPINRYKFTQRFPEMEELVMNVLELDGRDHLDTED
ncbi:hypothetical protein Clacol_006926 [Clathrus columnatus]|uniref:Cytochrome P450 n=1 Tax=Clathrus columnatus TaxID=1419009 RepID=A0AAV5AG23_9AGAM|nr:hypothetical protein Clacol_006926 [Clathrus columnatus]